MMPMRVQVDGPRASIEEIESLTTFEPEGNLLGRVRTTPDLQKALGLLFIGIPARHHLVHHAFIHKELGFTTSY
jgi:hypothetical protein